MSPEGRPLTSVQVISCFTLLYVITVFSILFYFILIGLISHFYCSSFIRELLVFHDANSNTFAVLSLFQLYFFRQSLFITLYVSLSLHFSLYIYISLSIYLSLSLSLLLSLSLYLLIYSCFFVNSPSSSQLLSVGQDDQNTHILWTDLGGRWSKIQQTATEKVISILFHYCRFFNFS